MRLALGLALAAACVFADSLPPVDESASDARFAAFRAKLLDTLRRRDVPSLIAVLDPQIRVSFGSQNGIAAFRSWWKLEKPSQSTLWTELATVLRLGATRDDPEFIAPYVFTRFPKTLDAYTHAAVIAPDAAMHAHPAAASKQTGRLRYDIVELAGERRNGWVAVTTDDGSKGWLREADIRSPLGYRAFFEKKGGSWKLTAFVNGD